MSDKPKKVMSPERLEKLAEARKKAVEARTKTATIKKAEKEKRQQEIDEKYNQITKPKIEGQPKDEEPPKEQTNKKPKEKVKKVFEIDSEDGSSSSSSDEEYDISPVKEKYRQKYKK
jgi:hypothetical protein